MLDKFVTGAQENWGRFSDPMIDALFAQQSREMDEQKRIQLVKEIETRLAEGLAHPRAVEHATGGALGPHPQLRAPAQPLDESAV